MKAIIAAAALLIATTNLANAEPTETARAYLSGIFGTAKQSDNSSRKSADNGYQLQGGYRFFRHFALEGRISNLGDHKISVGQDLVKTEFSALTGNAVGILPFGESGFELYGHVGAGVLSPQGGEQSAASENEESGTVGTAGVGLRFTPGKAHAMTVSASYDTYVVQGEDGLSHERYDQSLNVARLGLQYNF